MSPDGAPAGGRGDRVLLSYPSRSAPGVVRLVDASPDGLRCSCPGWRFRRGCRHVRDARARLAAARRRRWIRDAGIPRARIGDGDWLCEIAVGRTRSSVGRWYVGCRRHGPLTRRFASPNEALGFLSPATAVHCTPPPEPPDGPPPAASAAPPAPADAPADAELPRAA